MALLFGSVLVLEFSLIACNGILQLHQLQGIALKLNEQNENLRKQLRHQERLQAKYEDIQKQLVQTKQLEANFEDLEKQNKRMMDLHMQLEQRHDKLQKQLLDQDILHLAQVKQMEERYNELNNRILLKDQQILFLEERMKTFESHSKITGQQNELVHSKAVERGDPTQREGETSKNSQKQTEFLQDEQI